MRAPQARRRVLLSRPGGVTGTALLQALRRGDRVVTGGGIIGTVARVDNPEEVIVDIADNVRVRVLRSTITSVLAKPDPAAAREAARQKTETRAKVGTKD